MKNNLENAIYTVIQIIVVAIIFYLLIGLAVAQHDAQAVNISATIVPATPIGTTQKGGLQGDYVPLQGDHQDLQPTWGGANGGN